MIQPNSDTSAGTSGSHPLFERLRFVLVETSHPGNIGGAGISTCTSTEACQATEGPKGDETRSTG